MTLNYRNDIYLYTDYEIVYCLYKYTRDFVRNILALDF